MVLHASKCASSFFLINIDWTPEYMGNNPRDCVDGTYKWKCSCPIPFAWLLALNDAIHSTRLLAPYTTFSHSDRAKRASMPFCPASLIALQPHWAQQNHQQHKCHSCQTCSSSCPLMNQQCLQLCLPRVDFWIQGLTSFLSSSASVLARLVKQNREPCPPAQWPVN